jgi:PAS domain S-box-containing protein
MMNDDLIPWLRSCAKDEKAFEELKSRFQSITEDAQKARQNLWLLEQAIKNDYDSILITDLDLEHGGPHIVFVNEGFTRLTGYTREEVIGKTPRLLQGPKTDPETLTRLKHSLQEGHSFFGSAVNYRKDGSEFINQWDIHPIYNDAGELTHWVSYQHDITTKKRAEANYVEQQIDFDAMDEQSKRTLLDFDPDGNIIFANKAFRALIGFEKEELSHKKVWDLVTPRQLNALKARIQELSRGTTTQQAAIKAVFMHKSGIPVQVEITCQVHELTEGKLIRAGIQNLSLQKRIIKTLSKRKSSFTHLVERNADFTYHLNVQDPEHIHFEWVSNAFCKLTGHPQEFPLNATGWKALIHPEDESLVKEHIQKILEGKSTVTEYRIRTVEGKSLRVIDYGKPIVDPHHGSVTAISGAMMDVTKHKNELVS